MDIIPVFSSAYSMRSILSFDNEDRSIPALAKKTGIDDVFLVEDNLTSFLLAKKSLKEGQKLCFGLRIELCADFREAKDTSFHKVIIFASNDKGYKLLSNIYSKASTDFFNSFPRLDEVYLNSVWTDDLILAVPFYDSFVYRNSFELGACVPSFKFSKPVFFVEDNGLFFDKKLSSYVHRAKENFSGSKIQKVKSVFYNKKKDFLAWQTYKCIQNRSTLSVPNLNYCASDRFCLEALMEDLKVPDADTQNEEGSEEDFKIYGKKNYRAICFDFETENLNLYSTKPWQLAYIVFDRFENIIKKDLFLDWHDINVSEGAEKATRFDIREYRNSKKLSDAKTAIEEFNKELESADLVVGHNIIGFDMSVYNSTCARLGIKPVDFCHKVRDTLSLFRGYKLDRPINEGDDAFKYCMRMNFFVPKEARKRGFSTLTAMAKFFGIHLEEGKMHDALYDVAINVETFRQIANTLKI